MQSAAQATAPLATEIFELAQTTEVGCEIKARSTGASWRQRGVEAAALLIKVDGEYNQDLLLWAGDEPFTYRIALGRLPKGKHVVSVELNKARSAAGASRAEVMLLRRASQLPARNADDATRAEDVLAQSYSPVLYARANTIDRFTDVPLLMYYEVERSSANDFLVRYTVIFTHEDGGTPTPALMARWGRATDIEWIYQLRVRDGRVVEEIYQGVEHETKAFTGTRHRGNHPLLAVASDNNNFSDLACSAVRFAPLPHRVRLDRASRESVMDAEPWTYRIMTEELEREKRISDKPVGALIADPRDYLYIEAYGEQKGTALALDVRVNGDEQLYRSDLGDARLRIDRSGYFRTAVRLPAATLPEAIATITVRCEKTASVPSENRICQRVELIKAFVLNRDYTPRPVKLPNQSPVKIMPGDADNFSITR